MFDEFEDEQYEIDPPHAFAMLEGQPCSCPSRYYGGDCQHTVEGEEEFEKLNAVDPLIEAVKDLEAATDDYTFGVFVNVTNPDPEDVPVSKLRDAVIACSITVVEQMVAAEVTLFDSTYAHFVVPTELRDQAARAELRHLQAARADVVQRSYSDEWVDALPTS
jgi:hypothetical protein